MLGFFLYFFQIYGLVDMPLSIIPGKTDKNIYNVYEFTVQNCDQGIPISPTRCRPVTGDENTPLCFNSDKQTVDCDDTLRVGYYQFKTLADKEKAEQLIDLTKSVLYPDAPPDEREAVMHDEYLKLLTDSILRVKYDINDQEAAEMIANGCTLAHYNDKNTACDLYYTNISQRSLAAAYDYQFWKKESPFLAYGSNIRLSNILDEEIITRKVSLKQDVDIFLAEFAPNGTFIGFIPLENQLQHCMDSRENMNRWRSFGFNQDNKCYIDLLSVLSTDTDSFFDPFFVDGYTSNGAAILRPIPVIDRNFRDVNGNDVNRGGSTSSKRGFRRFFIKDDYSSNDVVQHLKSVELRFEMRSKTVPKPPILEVEYYQIPTANIIEDDSKVRWTSHSDSHPRYTFKVKFLQDYDKFWLILMIIFSIFCALALVFWLYRIIIFIRTDGEDGFSMKFILGTIARLLDVFATAFFIVIFAFSLYLFFFYKWQKKAYIYLPDNDELYLLPRFLWATFALKLASSLIFIYLQSTNDILIADWEPRDGTIRHGTLGWRRVIIANEWSHLVSKRNFSAVFTTILVVFLLCGLNLKDLANPIPSTKLVEGGEMSTCLEFAFISFVWLIALLVEWLFLSFVVRPIFGDPFINFIDLCSNSNVSVLMLMSPSHGFYIHGKSPNVSTEQTMDGLGTNLQNEVAGTVPTRGLESGKDDQVFEIFLAKEFRNELKLKYSSVKSRIAGPSVLSVRKQTAGNIPLTHADQYSEINNYILDFLRGTLANHKYVVQNSTFFQSFVGLPPTVIEDSVFTISSESSYKKSMLAGIDLKLQLFFLLLFCVIQMETDEPAIAGFVVIIANYLVGIVFRFSEKSNLSKKLLLDDRLYVD